MSEDLSRFKKLDFEGFKRLAEDSSLTMYEQIGFPSSYREGYERAIFADIVSKLPNLESTSRTIVDIGPGCTELPRFLIQLCEEKQHQLVLIDSAEMLRHLPDVPCVTKVAARFPHECSDIIRTYAGRVDVVLSYSVLHYVFVEASVFDYLDQGMELLAPGGEMLLGDVPNISKRKRFFSSAAGISFHQQFMRTTDAPSVRFNVLEGGEIDDSVLIGLMMRARLAGFDAYVTSQGRDLPMANRREDLLVRRP